MTTTKYATDALTDLVDIARTRANRARNQGQVARAEAHANIAMTLDAARTRLVQDGIEYLDAAWGFIEGGRKMLDNLHGNLDRYITKIKADRS